MRSDETELTVKPYLLAVKEHCDSLSKQDLVDMLMALARDMPAGERRSFLEKLRKVSVSDAMPVDDSTATETQLLERIENLRQDIESRIASIENGDYWDEYDDDWDDEPEYITESQTDDFEHLIEKAGDLFMDGHLEFARRVYAALFDLLDENDSYNIYSDVSNLREARARFSRCVYETADSADLVEAFFESMSVDAKMNTHRFDLSSEAFPLLRDVVDTRVETLDNWEWFLPAWAKRLDLCTGNRADVLRMEALQWLEGETAVSRLAREWASKQPRGYLYWIQYLESSNDWSKMRDVCLEAKDVLANDHFRKQAMDALVRVATILGDNELLLLGKREKFLSSPENQSLLEFLEEADAQNLRSQELDVILASKSLIQQSPYAGYNNCLYLEILLMAGRLDEAFEEGEKEKSVGWTYGKAGVLFGSTLKKLTENATDTPTIQGIFKIYAKENYNQIIKGLASVTPNESQQRKYLMWADRICRDRVERIVSQQHRKAYDRAAESLGALAECYVCLNRKDEAISLVNEFVRTKFPRHSAFRGEVKNVLAGSTLLKGIAG